MNSKDNARLIYLLLLLMCSFAGLQSSLQESDTSPEYWAELAARDLTAAKLAYRSIRDYQAKNAILFLGDGMGISSVTAGRILKGQLKGKSGEEETLEFERFPHTGLIKTYNTDMQTPDSAGTATAFICGVKAKSGTMGLNEFAISRNCTTQVEEHYAYSFLKEAQELGRSVGIVTTTRITHATPGAAYSHIAWRDWEDDTKRNKDVPNEEIRSKCPDIAQQLIDNAINYTVVFGGGRANFLPKSETLFDVSKGKIVTGRRSDSVNLLDLWKKRQAQFGRRAVYLETRQGLLDAPTNADVYLGLFAADHISYDLEIKHHNRDEPTLEEMTKKAIEILQRNPNGFVLLVEGGRIDHGHHKNQAKMALHELICMDKAIRTASRLTNSGDTLTVVTADHSHVFSIGGWGRRGQPIFGKIDYTLAGTKNSKGQTLANDGKPYTPLFYGDGPSAVKNSNRPDITDVDTENPKYQQQSLVPFESESHGAEDVPVYARGPGAHLFHTTHEQSYVAHVIKHSLCVGAYATEENCLGS